LFSTITVCLSASESGCAIARAMMSDEPPGVYGTTMRIVLAGLRARRRRGDERAGDERRSGDRAQCEAAARVECGCGHPFSLVVIARGTDAWGRSASRNQVLHRDRIVAGAEAVLAIERVRRLDGRQVELDTESRCARHLHMAADDRERLFVSAWPSCQIQCVSIAVTRPGAGGGDVGEHRERDVEVVVRVRAPRQAPVAARLRDAHRSGHRPEVRIGERDVDRLQRERVRELAPVGRDHVGRGRQAGRARNSASTSRPEKPSSAPHGSSA
jgi:hypothetical protein